MLTQLATRTVGDVVVGVHSSMNCVEMTKVGGEVDTVEELLYTKKGACACIYALYWAAYILFMEAMSTDWT